MKRYNVPRIIYINKLDRMGANPWTAIEQIRDRLNLKVAAVQVNMGLENALKGLIDIVRRKALYFDGDSGEVVREEPVPKEHLEFVEEKRQELIGQLADLDEEIAEKFLGEQEVSEEELKKAIRKYTLERSFSPVFMGSAYKNKGIQAVLDGVLDYLPNPTERQNIAFDLAKKNEKVELTTDPKKPFVGLAFKL